MCDDNAHNLLIDFNSPLQARLDKTLFGELLPLVPSPNPVNTNNDVISDVNAGSSDDDNNPFDFVDHQTNLNVRMLNDPFELAYYSSGENKELYNAPSNELSKRNTEVNSNASDSVLDNSNRENVSAMELLKEKNCDRTEDSLIENVTDPCIEVCVSFSDISPVRNPSCYGEKKIERVFEKHTEEENNLDAFNTNLKTEVSSTEAIDNSDEAIKAIVANRVNACIQNALHQSKLYYDNFTFNHDSSLEHAALPIRHNTSCLHNSLLQKRSKREINVSATDMFFRPSCLSSTDTLHQICKDPIAVNPVLKSNWNTPQRNVTCFAKSCDGQNKALCSPSRYSYSNARPENINSSLTEILNAPSPHFKIKPDLLECVGNLELRNRSCFGALWSSDSDHDKQLQNLRTKYEDKYKKQTEFLPVTVTGKNEMLEQLVKKNVGNTFSPDFLDSEGSPDVFYKNEKEKEDLVFLEASNVAFMFKSFTESLSDEEEDDILNCKPQWEKSDLKLPKFDSEEDGTELATEIVDCKLTSSSAQKIMSVNSMDNKFINKCDKEAFTAQDIVLPVVLPMVEKTDGNIRIKPKQVQQPGKKGPIKAIVPLGNMVRATGVQSKVSPPNGNKNGDNLSHVTSRSTVSSVKCETSSQHEVPRGGKPVNSKSDTTNRKGFGMKPLISASANTLAGGIPLVSPAVSLTNKESYNAHPTTPVHVLQSQQTSKLPSSVYQFNLSGIVATSTPAKKTSCSTSRNLMKTMPSPILVKGKESPPIKVPKTKKTEGVLKNRSFNGDQHEKKNKELSNKLHNRSKSASYANSKQPSPSQKENSPQSGRYSYSSAKKISIPSDQFSRQCTRTKTQRDVQPGILKSLKLNGRSIPGKQNVEMNNLLPGITQKKRSSVQLLPKLKNSLLEIDKENVRPL